MEVTGRERTVDVGAAGISAISAISTISTIAVASVVGRAGGFADGDGIDTRLEVLDRKITFRRPPLLTSWKRRSRGDVAEMAVLPLLTRSLVHSTRTSGHDPMPRTFLERN